MNVSEYTNLIVLTQQYLYIIIMYMRVPKPHAFDWDVGNREKNANKHNVSINECESVFAHNPFFLKDKDHSSYDDRYYAFGETDKGRLLLIVFTIRSDKIRVILARDLSRKEREYYQNVKSSIIPYEKDTTVQK